MPRQCLEKVCNKINCGSNALFTIRELFWIHRCCRELPSIKKFKWLSFLMFFFLKSKVWVPESFYQLLCFFIISFMLHIFFHKWTFIDMMSNLMVVCAMWKIWSWNFVYIMNSSIPIPWKSINIASIFLINYGFIVPHF